MGPCKSEHLNKTAMTLPVRDFHHGPVHLEVILGFTTIQWENLLPICSLHPHKYLENLHMVSISTLEGACSQVFRTVTGLSRVASI